MDNMESLLREEIERSAPYGRESVGDLIAHTRRLRRRRNYLSAGSAAVAVAAVAAVVVTLTGGASKAPHPAQPLKSHPPMSQVMEALMRRSGLVVGGEMVDSQHGFALVMRCTEPINYAACDITVQATVDGGRTFTKRSTFPSKTPGLFRGANLYAFDAGHLVIDQPEAPDESKMQAYPSDFPTDLPSGYASDVPSQYPGDLPSDFPTDLPPDFPTDLPSDFPSDLPGGYPSSMPMLPAERWASADGGLNWQQVSTDAGAPLAEIPHGARLVTDMSLSWGAGQLLVIGPDGITHPLAGAPAGIPVLEAVGGYSGGNEINGSFFLMDFTGKGPNQEINNWLVSRDRGRTWVTAHLPGPDAYYVLGGADGTTIYALSYGDIGISGSRHQARFAASTDGGLTWTEVPGPDTGQAIQPSRAVDPTDSAGANPGDGAEYVPVSIGFAPHGGLVVCDNAQLWILDRDATSWRKIESGQATYLLLGVRGGLFAVRSTDTTTADYQVSSDGATWQPVRLA